jgi:hypothetical protein
MLMDQELHEIFRTEIDFEGKSDIYRGTNPRTEVHVTNPDKIIITQEEMTFQTMKNHGILNKEISLIEDREEKVRGVDVESTTRKTKCRRY